MSYHPRDEKLEQSKTRLPDVPEDVRPLRAKFAGKCDSCKVPIAIGVNCFHSPNLKKIGCINCWGKPEQQTAFQKTKNDITDDPLQDKWQRLCTYYTTCILADSSKYLFDYSESEFPTVTGIERVFSNGTKRVTASGPGVEQHPGRSKITEPQEFIYGWPTVVAHDKFGKVKVAPLFVVKCDFTLEAVNRTWQMEQKSDPDLNIVFLSGHIFDASAAAEINAAVGDEIAFGNKEQLDLQVQNIAATLGLNCKDSLSSPLDARFYREPGIYNCALILNSVRDEASRDLLNELEILATKTDWKDTAAGLLIRDDLHPENSRKQQDPAPTAGPILLNRTQENATDSSRKNKLTVVTGPPGTGKSQLVVSAVANAWIDDATVLVTSTNNAAVDVAVQRAADLSKTLLMRTGNKGARDSLASLVAEAIAEIKNETDETSETSETFARVELRKAQTKRQQLHELIVSIEKYDIELKEWALHIEELSGEIWPTLNIAENFNFEIEIAQQVQLIFRFFLFRKCRLKKYLTKFGRGVKPEMLNFVQQWAGAIEKFASAKSLRNSAAEELSPSAEELTKSADEAWMSSSQQLLSKTVRRYIKSNPEAFSQIGTAGGGGLRSKEIELSMRALRGWASTTLSMRRNFPLKPGLFDLAIIDEASQCNVSYILPIAYRAKRLLVVGDPNQLSPIVQVPERTVSSIAESTGFSPEELDESGLSFFSGSAYGAFEHSAGIENVLLLNEHYRCHPKIARWFNQAFYSSTLEIMTDVSKMNPNENALFWYDMEGAAVQLQRGLSWRNQEEINLATQLVERFIGEGLTVAVVSPFSAQATGIQQSVEKKIGSEALGEIDFTSGTAHRLQGTERDVIIFSCCVAPGISVAAARWVEKERNLINVAVSRARQRLIIIGHPSMNTLFCPTLTSLREFAIDISEKGGRVGHRVDSEAEARLLDAMHTLDLPVLAKIDVEGFELDFAITSEKYKLNIEVDGEQHFDADKQQRRQDMTRDRMLNRSGWTVLRYPAWCCLLHPSDVARAISDYLEN